MSDPKTRQVIFFILWANRQGFKFRGTFRDKFTEKSTDFVEIFGANFGEKQSVKYSRFFGGKFR